MLILECSQGCDGRKEGRTDGSVTISLRNFVGEGIKSTKKTLNIKVIPIIKFIISNKARTVVINFIINIIIKFCPAFHQFS